MAFYPEIQDKAFLDKLYSHEEITENLVKRVPHTKTIQQVADELCPSQDRQKTGDVSQRKTIQELLPQQKLLGTYITPHTPYN